MQFTEGSSESKDEKEKNKEKEDATLPISTEAVYLPGDTQLKIKSLERTDEDTAILKFQITNNSDEEINIYHSLREAFPDSENVSGFSLIDVNAKEAYYPIRSEKEEEYGDKPCYCSDFYEDVDLTKLKPGETRDLWAGYPEPPKELDTVSVATPITAPIHDVPITDGDSDPPKKLPDDPDEPIIRSLHSKQENEETGTTRNESGDEINVALSSDVLFEVDESELTSEANEILEDTAEEIDNSGVEKVEIDGYTDDTGSDSINDPLSKERAKAVAERLTELIDRDDINYDTQGHGSDDPVADNSSEEGRAKNRRTTVSYSADQSNDEQESENGSNDSSDPADDDTILGEAGPDDQDEDTENLEVAVNAVQRSSSGGLTSLTYTITNNGNEEADPIYHFLKSGIFNCGQASDSRLDGIQLIDEKTNTKYKTLTKSNEDCLAPKGNGDAADIAAGESRTVWSSYWTEDETSKVTVDIPGFEPVKNVPVS
ncbi:OmpA family protein [Haloactinospora alba]|uniref:OmpA family protein n=1 Tax=Haloactinospora alba TaxID=405555 RepID=UPI001FE54327|nr:OmpA family protein [Haloactinospora alba]